MSFLSLFRFVFLFDHIGPNHVQTQLLRIKTLILKINLNFETFIWQAFFRVCFQRKGKMDFEIFKNILDHSKLIFKMCPCVDY